MRINNNISALNAWRNLTSTDFSLGKSLERLSSGFRINKAADDAAGLAISEKMRGQIAGLNQAVRNAQDAISLIGTAEGALNETHSILQRMRELAVQASSDTNTEADRFEIQKEINQLAEELTRIGDTTEFNTKALLDGSFTGTFHIGANENQTMSVSVADMRASALGVTAETAKSTEVDNGTNLDDVTGAEALVGGTYYVEVYDDSGTMKATLKSANGTPIVTGVTVDASTGVTFAVNNATYGTATVKATFDNEGASEGTITINVLQAGEGISVMTQDDAEVAITKIQSALDRVSAQRSNLGAVQNRLEHTIANLNVAAENLAAAESRIRDVDMAQEMVGFTRNQILLQAGTAMLAQANMKPQSVLQLLG